MTAPNGMETRAVGRIVTLAMNHACWMNSLTWNGRFGRARSTSSASAKSEPDWRRAPVRGAATSAHLADGSEAPADAGSDVRGRRLGMAPVPAADGTTRAAGSRRCRGTSAPGRALGAARALPSLVGSWRAIGGSGGSSWPDSAASSSASFSSRHADRADRLGVEELAHDRLLRAEQHLARAEHRQVLVVEQADVVGHRAGGVDVVRDDEERRVDLGVEVDEELVDVARCAPGRGPSRARR